MAIKLNKDAVYRAAKPKDKDYKISDGGGLTLLIKTDGVVSWMNKHAEILKSKLPIHFNIGYD